MKKISLFLFFCFTYCFAFAQQEEVIELVNKGIALHDEGKYTDAINVYSQALEIEPKSALVNYEIALTYSAMQDYNNVLKYCNVVIEIGDKNFLPSTYNILGSALDDLGKVDESIAVFEKAIEEFGDDYLLCFNLALNYMKLKNYNKAEEIILKGITTKPTHPSSNLLLGDARQNLNKTTESLLSYYFFLFLEADSNRSKNALSSILALSSKNVKVNKEKDNKADILFNTDNINDDKEMVAALIALSMPDVLNTVEGIKKKTDFELFNEKTSTFFNVLGELRKEDKKGLCWEFYVPFFYEITQSGHLETFCRYISQSYWAESEEWLEANSDKIESFANWLDNEYAW